MTRVVLARHGEAEYPEGGDRGGVLTERGRAQARALADSVFELEPRAVWSSSLARARETAAIAAAALGVETCVADGLQEYELAQDPADHAQLEFALRHWLDGDLGIEITPGQNGRQIAERVLGALDAAALAHADRTVLVISHGGAMIAALGAITPGRVLTPSHPDGRLREEDLPGGCAFFLVRGESGWELLGRR